MMFEIDQLHGFVVTAWLIVGVRRFGINQPWM
ncbi:hypothetical protein KR100_06885 [Synechococcus sp. KORDI-100]|nr:hypothetical protein KR100_06885 [Synechococcus sp. KORDI-100]